MHLHIHVHVSTYFSSDSNNEKYTVNCWKVSCFEFFLFQWAEIYCFCSFLWHIGLNYKRATQMSSASPCFRKYPSDFNTANQGKVECKMFQKYLLSMYLPRIWIQVLFICASKNVCFDFLNFMYRHLLLCLTLLKHRFLLKRKLFSRLGNHIMIFFSFSVYIYFDCKCTLLENEAWSVKSSSQASPKFHHIQRSVYCTTYFRDRNFFLKIIFI